VPTDRIKFMRRCAAVTGAAGMLGTHLVRALLNAGYEVACSDIDCEESQPWGPDGPTLTFADVTRFSELEDWIRETRPSVVCHLAAKTDLEWCELNPHEAWLTNAVGTSNVARICARSHGSRLVYISTAGVFDGESSEYIEEDVPRPINEYGRSKFAGEWAVLTQAPGSLVVRAGWMVGGPDGKDHKFVGLIIEQLRAGRSTIDAVVDKWGSPTYAPDFALNLVALLDAEEASGIFHMVSEGRVTRADIARQIVGALGAPATVNPVASDHFSDDFFAPRPASECLKNQRLHALGLNLMRQWPEPVGDYRGGHLLANSRPETA
jgi:dTDP-4-dehydrorhamnose reductase